MKITFEKLFNSVDEVKAYTLDTPFKTAAITANIICSYTKENKENFYNMLQVIMGDVQPLSNLLKQEIDDRMNQNDKWKYIGKSYFNGSNKDNDYTPSVPYEIEVNENPYSYTNEGYARLLLKSSGADSERPITLRKLKDGRWLLWSDSILGLLSDIRQPESDNPWA